MKTRVAIALFVICVAADLALADWSLDWRIVPALLVGWYLADLASGIVHMVMDYLPCPKGVGLDRLFFYRGARDSDDYAALRREVMARIGPIDRLLFDFKIHHPRPGALGRRSLYQQVGSTIRFMGLPIAAGFALLAVAVPVPGFVMAALLAFLLGGVFSQYFHGSLHRLHNPRFISAMRQAGLLMTPARHDVHHRSLQQDFSTINGWSNPLLNVVFRSLRAHGKLADHGLEPS